MDKEIVQLIHLHLENPKDCLNLGHRNLTVLPSEIKTLSSVKKLLLNENNLIIPPNEISIFSNTLIELILSNNNLTVFPSEFASLKRLQVLDLSFNCIGVLPGEIGYLRSLQKLWINQCNLLLLPSEIGKLENLTHLGIKYNKLKALPSALNQLKILQWLNCESNELNDLSEIEISDEIYFLNLNNNILNNIPHLAKNKPKLKVLLMCGNDISSLDDKTLLELTNLSKIDLRENPMQTLPSHWKGMNHILVGPKEVVTYVEDL